MENIDHIHVLRTNIETVEETAILEQVFSNLPEIEQWSIDLEDVDSVLRIVSTKLTCTEIIKLLSPWGFHCYDLDF